MKQRVETLGTYLGGMKIDRTLKTNDKDIQRLHKNLNAILKYNSGLPATKWNVKKVINKLSWLFINNPIMGYKKEWESYLEIEEKYKNTISKLQSILNIL